MRIEEYDEVWHQDEGLRARVCRAVCGLVTTLVCVFERRLAVLRRVRLTVIYFTSATKRNCNSREDKNDACQDDSP